MASLDTDTLSTQSDHIDARTSGTIALGGLAVFVGGFVLMHFIQSDLDPVVNFGSDYAYGEHGWIMRLAFVGLAVAAAALALGLIRSVVASRARTVAFVALAAVVIGMLASAAFNTDPPKADGTTGYTNEGTLHDLAGIVAFLGMIVAAIAINRALRHDPSWQRAVPIARVIAWVMPVALVVMLFVGESSTPGTDGYAGLAQRLWLLIPVGGATLLATAMLRHDAAGVR
jgi:hypothetical protein